MTVLALPAGTVLLLGDAFFVVSEFATTHVRRLPGEEFRGTPYAPVGRIREHIDGEFEDPLDGVEVTETGRDGTDRRGPASSPTTPGDDRPVRRDAPGGASAHSPR